MDVCPNRTNLSRGNAVLLDEKMPLDPCPRAVRPLRSGVSTLIPGPVKRSSTSDKSDLTIPPSSNNGQWTPSVTTTTPYVWTSTSPYYPPWTPTTTPTSYWYGYTTYTYSAASLLFVVFMCRLRRCEHTCSQDSNKGENAVPTESSEKGLQYPKHSSILYSFFHPQLPKYQMYLLLFDRVLTRPIQSQLIDVQDAFVPLST
jgi:hypothetical protein